MEEKSTPVERWRWLLLWLALPLTGCTILDRRNEIALPPRSVILTFDDGPNPDRDVTKRLLAVLREHDVRAAMCLIGERVVRHPDLVRLVAADGHVLVNHSHHHRFPLFHSAERVKREMELADGAIGDALGVRNYRSRYFRPPNGLLTPAVRRAMREYGIEGYFPITYFAWDTFLPPGKSHLAVKWIVGKARRENGGVFLLHEYRARGAPPPDPGPTGIGERGWVPGAVDDIISTLKAEGFRFPDPEIIFQPAGGVGEGR